MVDSQLWEMSYTLQLFYVRSLSVSTQHVLILLLIDILNNFGRVIAPWQVVSVYAAYQRHLIETQSKQYTACSGMRSIIHLAP